MKKPLDEAKELFRENEVRAGEDREKANLYHGLRLLTEGLRRLERELQEVESEIQEESSRFNQRRPLRSLRQLMRARAAPGR